MIGHTISHYKILEKLGEGGMGVVYKAQDTKLDRLVALKFLPQHLAASVENTARFIREAKAASSLNHPNILTIYDFDEVDGMKFIVMEYVEGHELKNIVGAYRNTPLPIEKILYTAIQIAEGLKAAHSKGIVHRDIKSENIMVTNDGRVKIMDFGLAQFLNTGADFTRTGRVVGTAHYMSPEQIEGKHVDERSDIFSFGVLLYEMLTRTLPFSADYDLAVLYLIVNADPQPPIEVDPSIPSELNQLVLRCLMKLKEERFQSCDEISSELDALLKRPYEIAVSPPAEKLSTLVAVPTSAEDDQLFVGREKERKQLHESIERLKTGSGHTVIISGEAGIGKSRLALYAANEAKNLQMTVFMGRCLFREGGLSYHPFVDALKRSFRTFDQRVLEVLIRRGASLGIDLASRLSLIKAFLNLSTESVSLLNKEQLWDAVLSLFKIMAVDRPLVLVVDDLHWADKTTLGFFSFIARNIGEIPLLLLGLYREFDVESELDFAQTGLMESIRQLKIEGFAEQVDLRRFNAEETSAAVQRILNDQEVDPPILRHIFENTQGNPLFVHELVSLMKSRRSIRHDGSMWRLETEVQIAVVSERVHNVIMQRLDRLTKDEHELLEIASCEGNHFQSEALAECLGVDRITVLKQLQTLEKEHHLIRHDQNQYRFDHPLIRQVLYEGILDELRQEYHRMIGTMLIERYGKQEAFASRIAYQLIASGQEEESLGYLLSAANRAKELHATEEAMNAYEKMKTILERHGRSEDEFLIQVEEGLGDVCLSMGNAERAQIHYSQFLDLTRRASNHSEEPRALRKSAEASRSTGYITEALETCREAIDLATRCNDTQEKLNCMNTLAFIHANRGEYDRTIEISREALSTAESLSDLRNQSISLSNLGFAHWHMGNYRSALEQLNNAMTIQRSIGDKRGLATTLNYLGLAYWKLGQYEQGLDSSFESLKIKKSIADYRAIPGSLNVVGDIYRDVFDFDKAIQYHNESLSLAREHNNKGAMCDNIRDLGVDHMMLGDYQSALRYFEEVRDLSKVSGITWYETRSYISLGELYLLMGDKEKARLHTDLGLQFADKLNANELIIEALWVDARLKENGTTSNGSESVYRQAIDSAEKLGLQTFLWQLYFDFSQYLKQQKKLEETRNALKKSKTVLQTIIDHFHDAELKQTFLKAHKVKQVLGG